MRTMAGSNPASRYSVWDRSEIALQRQAPEVWRVLDRPGRRFQPLTYAGRVADTSVFWPQESISTMIIVPCWHETSKAQLLGIVGPRASKTATAFPAATFHRAGPGELVAGPRTLPRSADIRLPLRTRSRSGAADALRQHQQSLPAAPAGTFGFVQDRVHRRAGRCLVMQVTLAERSIIIVLLDSWEIHSCRRRDPQRSMAGFAIGRFQHAPDSAWLVASGRFRFDHTHTDWPG